jgi:DNA-binding protein HU-beta
MNKSQLVDALTDRLGDRRTAATALDAVLQIVVDTVRAGDSVSLAGFGVFESRARAARTGRNPRTGESVAVPATTVPAFRPGTGFRSAVARDETPAATPARRRAAATNGAGAAEALTGAVELTGPAAATLVDSPPPASKRSKVDGKKVEAKKADTKKAEVKKADAKKADKKSAKGKKGKK